MQTTAYSVRLDNRKADNRYKIAEEIPRSADDSIMISPRAKKPTERCAYVGVCYLADALKCRGYRSDCALFLKSNGQPVSEDRFHDAMDRLIDKVRAKHERLLVG